MLSLQFIKKQPNIKNISIPCWLSMARYALVIGINDYDNPNFLPPLSKPAKDAEAVAKFLENTGTFANVERLPNRWIAAEKRYEVVPGKVTGDEVLQALKQILVVIR